MKLLIVTDAWHPQVNGVVRTYEYLIEELQERGHDIHVISPSDFKWTFPMPGYSEIRLAFWTHRKLYKMIEALNPEHIHIATEGPLGWAANNYCTEYQVDFTTSYHTHFPDYVAKRLTKFTPFLYDLIHEISKRVVRKFHAPAKCMMIATQSLEDELKSWGFKTPMQRLSRGVVLDLFYTGEKTVMADLKTPIALYVGRVAIEKNLDAFLDMDWDGSKVVVGDGPSLKVLQKKYPDIYFLGKKEGKELAAYYRSADLFVFPSKTDTFGIVLIEALASGLPIAAFNVTGPKDIMTQDFMGALTEDDLAAAAKQALTCGTPQQREAYVKKTYTWEHSVDQFLNAVGK